MIMNRIKIIGIFILTLTVVTPDAALANWQVYYTGKAAGMFGAGGRGNFSTHSQCEAYRSSSAGFERNNSYCSGFDNPSYRPPTPSRPSGDDGTAAREQEKQRQLQLQSEQKERELELARQKKFAEEKDKLLGSFKGNSTGTLGLKTDTASKSSCIKGDPLVKRPCILNGSPCCPPYKCLGKFPSTYCVMEETSTDSLGLKGTGTGTLGLKKPTGKHKRDSAIADSTAVDMQKLTKYREELYKLQVDQQKITQSFGDITREFSDIGKGVKEIIDVNEDKLFKTAADATTDLIAIRKKNMEFYKQAYDIIDTITSYPKIMDMDDLVKQLKGTISYIGKYKKNIQLLDWTVKAAEAWKDFYQGSVHAKRLYELELECRALLLDTGNNRTRQQKLMQEIEVLRQRIHEISGTPLSQIPATPLRPAGLGSYVPRLYPTEESLTKARQKGVK